MDFLKIVIEEVTTGNKKNQYRVKPDFIYGRSKDLITKGGAFYAFWDGKQWSDNLEYLCKLIDNELVRVGQDFVDSRSDFDAPIIKYSFISSAESKRLNLFNEYCKNSRLEDKELNTKVKFASEVLVREDYTTYKVDYDPLETPTPAFDEIIGTLYDPDEAQKIMWAVGAALSGDMIKIQKMIYLYGGKGTGKSTIINIITGLFGKFAGTINLKKLTSDTDSFATSEVRNIPLLIDHDTDLKVIKNDTNLLKLISHEDISINKKFLSEYYSRFEGLLVCASNQRFGVRNADSGITRRVIVVRPSGITLPRPTYDRLMEDIKYESAGIAYKCIQVYQKLGHKYYDQEVDVDIIEDADFIFRFMRNYYDELSKPEGILLSRAYKLFLQFLEDDYGSTDMARTKAILRDGLKIYYNTFQERKMIDGSVYRNFYNDIIEQKVFPERFLEKVKTLDEIKEDTVDYKLGMEDQESILDNLMATYPAQYANRKGNPQMKWGDVTTTLKDIDTSRLHWVRVPLSHIVIDFDLKDEDGNKSLELNLEAASKFPETYAELSKSGNGVHLHYIYEGNVNDLANLYSENIEIKTYKGNAALRRIKTLCNDVPVRHISSGLPFKSIKETEMYDNVKDIVWTEKTLRKFVLNALNNKHHPNTRPEILYIISEMTKAKEQGLKYDLTDLRSSVQQKAMMSTNNKVELLKEIQKITWNTIKDDTRLQEELTNGTKIVPREEIVFYDIEVYPNLFVVVWKKWHDDEITRWIDPTPEQIEYLCSFPLVGFNNRRYDNHILYGRILGGSNMDLFTQSNRIINDKNGQSGFYSAAYELSYADIYEYTRKKQSLKKWQVELGINHVEMEIPWDQPVPDHLVDTVVEYCVNDVVSTEALFDATYADYVAREVLATLCQGSMNATNNGLTTKFIFGDDPNPQTKLVYTHLEETFPGYVFSYGKSSYRGEDPSEGGYVYTEPGIYENVSLSDVTSLHPNSAINLNYFGPYTERYKTLLDARVWIKHRELDKILEHFPQLKPYLEDENNLKTMDTALKIPINSVYGLTSAKFDNKCRHPENKDNIIAKRGALFMIDLKYAVQAEGYRVVHIKTDSIKVANTDKYIQDFIYNFGKLPQYNYNFEHEHTYSNFALIDKAQYICQDAETGEWSATGAQFQDPYTFKRLWTKENLVPEDYMLIKSTKGHMYLGNEFVGKVGKVYASKTGQELKWTDDKENFKYLSGTKGTLFRKAEDFVLEDVDMDYYDNIVTDSVIKLLKVGKVDTKILPDFPKDIEERVNDWYSANKNKKVVTEMVENNFSGDELLLLPF